MFCMARGAHVANNFLAGGLACPLDPTTGITDIRVLKELSWTFCASREVRCPLIEVV